MNSDVQLEKSPFQQALMAENFSNIETALLGPQLDALVELRKEKIFFGELFKPERKVLYGAESSLFDAEGVHAAGAGKMALALCREMGCLNENVALRSLYSVLLCDFPDLRTLFELAAAGFDACLCSPESLDLSGIQYFTEWCRELRVSLIWLLKAETDVQKIIESDAPYVSFVFDEFKQDENAFAHLLRLRRSLSQEFIATCIYRSKTEAHLLRIARAGFDCYIEI